jgi:hypothetical protein
MHLSAGARVKIANPPTHTYAPPLCFDHSKLAKASSEKNTIARFMEKNFLRELR